EPSGDDVAPSSQLAHLLDLNGLIEGGRFSLGFRYSPDLLSDASVAGLLQAFERELRALIHHCLSCERSATASDFPLARLSQAELERMQLELGDVQDLYLATPLQQGLLFHSLAQADAGLYIYQRRITLSGQLEAHALRQAWDFVVSR